MACDAVLGATLYEATVTDSTILGGQTMRAYEADWSLLGSGEVPWTPAVARSIVDAVDVADLESEAAITSTSCSRATTKRSSATRTRPKAIASSTAGAAGARRIASSRRCDRISARGASFASRRRKA